MGSPEGEIVVLGPGEADPKRVSELFHTYSRVYTAVLIGECEIDYQGRAVSKAPPGVRIVIYKPDGSLLVHEGRDRDPLNWQPPGSMCASTAKSGLLEITCRNRKFGYEVVVIRFKRILHAVWCKLSSKGLEIYGTERDLVEAIASNPGIIVPGASVIGREVETPSGKVDLVLRDIEGNIYVVEVKNEKAGIAAVNQLARYVEHMESVIARSPGSKGRAIGVLISPGVTQRAREALISKGYIYIDPGSFKAKKPSTLAKYFKNNSWNS